MLTLNVNTDMELYLLMEAVTFDMDTVAEYFMNIQCSLINSIYQRLFGNLI